MGTPSYRQLSRKNLESMPQVACIMSGPWGPGGDRSGAVGGGGLRLVIFSLTSGQKFAENS